MLSAVGECVLRQLAGWDAPAAGREAVGRRQVPIKREVGGAPGGSGGVLRADAAVCDRGAAQQLSRFSLIGA